MMDASRAWPYVVVTVLLAPCSGCTPVPEGPLFAKLRMNDLAALQSVKDSVVILDFPAVNGGCSALVIGPRRLLTCRHCLSEWVLTTNFDSSIQLKLDGQILRGEPAVPAAINGKSAAARPAGFGADDSVALDWAILELTDSADEVLPLTGRLEKADLDFTREVPMGEEVLFIGYPGQAVRQAARKGRTPPPTIVRGRVARQPNDAVAPTGVLYVKLLSKGDFRGMSGGPAVIWDPVHNRPVVIGIIYGASIRGHLDVVRPKGVFDTD